MYDRRGDVGKVGREGSVQGGRGGGFGVAILEYGSDGGDQLRR